MNIKILSDSTCDLSAQLLQEHNITLTPLIIMKDEQEYLDGISITPSEIFAHVAAGGSLCSTAALSVGTYQEMFAKYSGEYDGVLQITIGSGFSSCYQNACIAASEFDNVRVIDSQNLSTGQGLVVLNIGSGFSSCYQNACIAASEFDNVRVIDSQNLSTGQGLVVLKACELAKTATSLDELKQQLDEFTGKVEASFLLDRLEYMAKGGRCSMVTALGANLLGIHGQGRPLLHGHGPGGEPAESEALH